MTKLLYLDQNAFSDLRERKRNALFKLIYGFLKKESGKIRVVYSNAHLDEIRQIPREEYIREHIDLLRDFNAIYILPVSTELSEKDPECVWKDYLENEGDNERLGINAVIKAQDLIFRKFSGLPVKESFDKLHSNLTESLAAMLNQSKAMLENSDSEEFGENGKEIIASAHAKINEQLLAISNMRKIEIGSSQLLGPRPLRNLEQLKKMNIEGLPPEQVIPALDSLFKSENANFTWNDYFDDTVHNQIARCYTLMNWAGYYADDFTRTKGNSDRFNASFNDMVHVRNAAGSSYLCSGDQAFLKKATACYKHLRVPTQVVTPNELYNLVKN